MERPSDVEIDLFRAFLDEEDAGMASLMAEVLGICDDVVDLVRADDREASVSVVHV